MIALKPMGLNKSDVCNIWVFSNLKHKPLTLEFFSFSFVLWNSHSHDPASTLQMKRMPREWPNNKMAEVGPRPEPPSQSRPFTSRPLDGKERHICSVFEVHLLHELSFTLTLMTAPTNKRLTLDSLCPRRHVQYSLFLLLKSNYNHLV